ncbi:MAG: acylphosphatase [Simkania sp.]|nr:acylphosphatase [Simkania sp.]
MKAWRALVSGRVQNVGFRQTTKRKATTLGTVK